MKALEMLKFIYKDCEEWEDKGFAVAYPTNDLSEAIKELEDLQSRSCENCKYNKEQDDFYSFSEERSYIQEELFKKFNIAEELI